MGGSLGGGRLGLCGGQQTFWRGGARELKGGNLGAGNEFNKIRKCPKRSLRDCEGG